METTRNIFVNFSPEGIRVGYKLYYKEEGGKVTGYIPGFDLVYSAFDVETLRYRAEAMIKHFFDYWITQESWKQLVLKLHKLGFRADQHDLQMKKLLNNSRPDKTKFEARQSRLVEDVFSGLENVNSITTEKELAY